MRATGVVAVCPNHVVAIPQPSHQARGGRARCLFTKSPRATDKRSGKLRHSRAEHDDGKNDNKDEEIKEKICAVIPPLPQTSGNRPPAQVRKTFQIRYRADSRICFSCAAVPWASRNSPQPSQRSIRPPNFPIICTDCASFTTAGIQYHLTPPSCGPGSRPSLPLL